MLRPNPPARKDTFGILSYYQSDDAGLAYPSPETGTRDDPKPLRTNAGPHQRKMSTASSPSEYSPNSEDEQERNKFFPGPVASAPKASEAVRRRPSIPSEGGADRRRLAIVDIRSDSQESANQGKGSAGARKDSLRSRRGVEAPMEGLALVAPPDASPKTYTHLTPPTTAPLLIEKGSTAAGNDTHHSRSLSEATATGKTLHKRKSSRNVGIIGTTKQSDTMSIPQQEASPEALRPPIFQMPQSRSPSPGSMAQETDSGRSSRQGKQEFLAALGVQSPSVGIVTPAIGDGKRIYDPVAAPVIISLTPSTPRLHTADPSFPHSTTTGPLSPEAAPSPYLYYQPGVHAKAGPLPPPPRAIFDSTMTSAPPPRPPRPPRVNSPPLTPTNPARARGDMAPVNQAMSLPVPEPAQNPLNAKSSTGSLRSDAHSLASEQSEIILPR